MLHLHRQNHLSIGALDHFIFPPWLYLIFRKKGMDSNPKNDYCKTQIRFAIIEQTERSEKKNHDLGCHVLWSFGKLYLLVSIHVTWESMTCNSRLWVAGQFTFTVAASWSPAHMEKQKNQKSLLTKIQHDGLSVYIISKILDNDQ